MLVTNKDGYICYSHTVEPFFESRIEVTYNPEKQKIYYIIWNSIAEEQITDEIDGELEDFVKTCIQLTEQYSEQYSEEF